MSAAQVVTYKWLARHHQLPANVAKQILWAFAEAHAGKVAVTHLLSGYRTLSGGSQSTTGSPLDSGSGACTASARVRHIYSCVENE